MKKSHFQKSILLFSILLLYKLGNVLAQAPVITGFTPGAGCAGTVSVVITGTDFVNVSAVNFGGTPAQTFIVNSPTQITATPGVGTTGILTVTNPFGTGASVAIFTINPVPAAPTSVTAIPNSICAGDSSNLNAVSAGNVIYWYTTPTGGTPIGSSASGANFAVGPTVTTIYYAEAATAALGSSDTFNYTGAIQNYTVPPGVTSISIDARGAQGGGSFGGAGGLGARMLANYAVTPGQVLSIVVPQQGLLQVGGNAQNSSGGGGGAFVYTPGPTLLVAAGGGGGKCNYNGATPLHPGAAGSVGPNGNPSSDGAGLGGVGGNGGNAGLWTGTPCSGGGAGWLTNGGGPYGGLGLSTWVGGPGYCAGGGGGCGGVGGFGGGGGGGNLYGGGGGGGGYSGGGGGTDPTHGGGGGSFSVGTGQNNTAGYQTGDGQVIITPDVSGCASLTRTPVTVTVHNDVTNNVTQSACVSYFFNGNNITTSGMYYDTLATAFGCDSFINLNLTINTVDLNVSQAGALLTSAATGATYQWINCSNSMPVAGATAQTFTPAVSGSYAVIVTQNGCTDTSLCKTVVISGTEIFTKDALVSIYPNPADQQLQIEIEPAILNRILHIYDASGRLLSSHKLVQNKNTIPFHLLSKGMYVISIEGLHRKWMITK